MDPIDRRERVRQTETGNMRRQQRIIEDAAAARQQTLDRVGQFIWLLYFIAAALILVRVFLKLIAAPPAQPFAGFIYTLSEPLVALFRDLPRSTFFGTPGVIPQNEIEFSAFVALLVYAFIAFVLVRLVKILFSKSSARSVSTIEHD